MNNNLLSLSPEQFYKIEFFPFRSTPTPNMSGIAERREGDNLGFHNFRISEFEILKLSIF